MIRLEPLTTEQIAALDLVYLQYDAVRMAMAQARVRRAFFRDNAFPLLTKTEAELDARVVNAKQLGIATTYFFNRPERSDSNSKLFYASRRRILAAVTTNQKATAA